MPCTQVVAVIRLLGVTCCGSEVACVSEGSAAVILVISRRGAGPVFETAPCGPVTVREILGRSIRVSEISGGEDRTGNLVDQLGRGLRAGQSIATGNVSSADQDRIRGARRGGCWSRVVAGLLQLSLRSRG